MSRLPSYTLEQVKKRAAGGDAWTVVSGHVYDLTKFILEHPGKTCAEFHLHPWVRLVESRDADARADAVLLLLLNRIGGERVLVDKMLGKDGTEAFEIAHAGNVIAKAQLKQLIVGRLLGAQTTAAAALPPSAKTSITTQPPAAVTPARTPRTLSSSHAPVAID